jgi:hypothetical protein
MTRQAEVRKMMNAVGRESGRQYQVRGPLTVAQVEQELFGGSLDSDSMARASGNTDFAKAWDKVKRNYRSGDELYFVNSDMRSWSRLNGWRGYVLVRQDRVVDGVTTFMN